MKPATLPKLLNSVINLNSINRFLLTGAALFLLQFHSFASESPVRFVTEHWPPYNYLNGSGEVVGLTTKIVDQIIVNLGLNTEIEVFHWARAIQLAEFEKNVFIYSIYRTQAREHRFQWICPLLNIQPVAFYRLKVREDIKLHNLEDAKQFSISVMNGDLTMQMLLKSGFEKGRHFDTSLDELTNVRKLLHGRIDLIVQEENALQHRLGLLNAARASVVRLEPLGKETANTICIATGTGSDKRLVEQVKKELNKIKAR